MKAFTSLKGEKPLLKKLERMRKTHAKGAMRKATRAATAVVLSAVKEAVPVDEGVTRKMMTNAVRNRGFRFTGYVGADVAKLREQEATGLRPANVDWLLEKGHVLPDGTFVPPTNFMEYAASVSLPKAEQVYVDRLGAEIDKAASR